jgi:transcriptional regulator with XRE-family HTH domain
MPGSTLSFGELLRSVRTRDGLSQVAMAEVLGISKAKLCDLEKGRRHVSIPRAAEFARKLGDSEEYFIKVLINEQLNEANLGLECEIKSA